MGKANIHPVSYPAADLFAIINNGTPGPVSNNGGYFGLSAVTPRATYRPVLNRGGQEVQTGWASSSKTDSDQSLKISR